MASINTNVTITPTLSTEQIIDLYWKQTHALLSDRQLRVLYIVPSVTGSLSILGSSLILLMLYKRGNRKWLYHRLLLAMSSVDILVSFWIALGALPVPKETQNPRAKGNWATCSMNGFVIQLSLCTAFYNFSLLFYYYLMIRCKWKENDIKRRLEVPMHLFSLGVPIVLGIVGLSLELYTPNGLGFQRCYIGTYPPGCDQLPGVECFRGSENSKLLQMWFSIYAAAPAYTGVAILTLLIYQTARQEYRRSSVSDRTRVLNSHREMKRQSLMYGILFFNTFIWTCIPPRIQKSMHDITAEELVRIIYPIQVVAVVFWPLQGLFNFLIFARPRFVRLRHVCQDESLWWVCKETIWGAPVKDRQYANERMRKSLQHSSNSASILERSQDQSHSSNPGSSWDATSTSLRRVVMEENSGPCLEENVETTTTRQVSESPGDTITPITSENHPEQQQPQALETVEENKESPGEKSNERTDPRLPSDESTESEESLVYDAYDV
jgi:hypothetical protein